jgi:hydrogenase expression/formation protein HypD
VRFVDEYRDPESVRRVAAAIGRVARRPWTIMEVCGGQTHAIVRFGLDELLPDTLTLVHGPGCPVCVTSVETLDKAMAIAARPDVIFCSYGDMLRVPGSHQDLQRVKAAGGDVRVVYSPLEALRLAHAHPERQVVFLAVGFETTAPAHAMAVRRARDERLNNFSLLVSHVLVPPAMATILDAAGCRVQGFLAAGHVCTVMGVAEYESLVRRHHVPIVVTGFEPVDLLEGVHRCVVQLEQGRAEVENAYARAVRPDGNPTARALVNEVFTVVSRKWRGIGAIPDSGLGLAPAYASFDAECRFDVGAISAEESPECQSGLVLQGRKKPHECPAFGTRCTPERPLGATMVSAEGACAAYYRYRRPLASEREVERA